MSYEHRNCLVCGSDYNFGVGLNTQAVCDNCRARMDELRGAEMSDTKEFTTGTLADGKMPTPDRARIEALEKEVTELKDKLLEALGKIRKLLIAQFFDQQGLSCGMSHDDLFSLFLGNYQEEERQALARNEDMARLKREKRK